jgi:TetR/AcrR family transcriptional repressor of nem operon
MSLSKSVAVRAPRKDGIATRERILDAAQELILERGYSGMTVDNVLGEVELTKGAFFHHFKSKDELAMALLQRFAERDAEIYRETRERAEKLSDDPLQQLLIFVRLFEEMFDGLAEPYPGCLFASYLYELQLFGDETRKLIRNSFEQWRSLLREKIEAVVRKYPPQAKVDASHLADAFTVVLEGAFITGKAMNEPQVVADQLRLYRNYVELLFRQPGKDR